tara:strand:+ start:4948 stop:5127 length:180 start_codon:yes stop_codon:yes gene_type:complete
MGWQSDQPYIDAEESLVMEFAFAYEAIGFSPTEAEEMAEDAVTLEMIEHRAKCSELWYV